ncbi:MAG TPA: hypothetical protein VNM72_08905 [Blastocatellia bacterium]|nr:hypothetical protein [Blastocatellia bacterium]
MRSPTDGKGELMSGLLEPLHPPGDCFEGITHGPTHTTKVEKPGSARFQWA